MNNISSRWDEVVLLVLCSINILSLTGQLNLTFVDEGGLGKMWKLFGEKTEELMEELNKELAA